MNKKRAFKVMRAPAGELLLSYGVKSRMANGRDGVVWFNMAKCPACDHTDYQCGVSESVGRDGKLVHGVHCFHRGDNQWNRENIPYEDFLVSLNALSLEEASMVKNYSKGSFVDNKKPKKTFNVNAAHSFYKRLLNNQDALDYLYQRGLRKHTLERFYLGLSREYVNKKTGEVKADALLCPLKDRSGNFQNRNAYYNIPDVTKNPISQNSWMKGEVACYYGEAIEAQSVVFVCEGLKDLWITWQYLNTHDLLDDILLISSTHGQAIPKEWRFHKFWKDFDDVYLGYDNDTAGDVMARKLAVKTGRDCRRVKVPKKYGKDWTDFWKKGGKIRGFKKLLHDAPEVIQKLEEPADNAALFGRLSFDPVDINGAFHGGYLYYPVQTLLREKETIIEAGGQEIEEIVERIETVVLRSDRTIHTAVESKAKRGTNRNQKIWRLTDGTLIDAPPRPSSYASWSWDSINEYLDKQSESRPLKDILKDVYNHLRASIWLPYSEDYALLTLVVPVTFAQVIFDAIPLLIANGPAGTGKSQLGIAMSNLCANSTVIGQTSAASIARLIDESRGFVVLDDLESLGNKKGKEAAAFGELAQALKLSYNKSTSLKIWTDVKTMKTEKLNFYGVKLINNTQGVDEILGSRMLHIQTRLMPPDAIERFHSQSAAGIQTLNRLRNELHCWVFENVDLIASHYAELFPKKTDRADEITAPLKVFAELSEDEDLRGTFLSALAMQRRKQSRPDDPGEVLWEAVRSIIIQGYDWVVPSHVINEMKTLMPDNFDQEYASQIPEWQQPAWVGRQLRLFDLVDQKSEGRRFRIRDSQLRAYPIKRQVIKEVVTWAKDKDVELKEPGTTPVTDFCKDCDDCPYRPVNCTLMAKGSSSRPVQRVKRIEKIRGKGKLVNLV